MHYKQDNTIRWRPQWPDKRLTNRLIYDSTTPCVQSKMATFPPDKSSPVVTFVEVYLRSNLWVGSLSQTNQSEASMLSNKPPCLVCTECPGWSPLNNYESCTFCLSLEPTNQAVNGVLCSNIGPYWWMESWLTCVLRYVSNLWTCELERYSCVHCHTTNVLGLWNKEWEALHRLEHTEKFSMRTQKKSIIQSSFSLESLMIKERPRGAPRYVTLETVWGYSRSSPFRFDLLVTE